MAKYQIRVLEVGYDPHFPAGVAFDFWNMADQQAYSPFSMTLVQGEGRNILFDCGMDTQKEYVKNKTAMEGDQNCHNPAEVLESVGLHPEDIDAVVLSHCHWDHISGLNYFPNAVFYVQREELDNWNRAMKDPLFPVTHKMVVDQESMDTLNQYVAEGKVHLLHGDVIDLFPGISVKKAVGHSFAQNILFVEDEEQGRFAIIGDVAMRPESFEGNEAFPCYLPNLKFSVGSIESIMDSYRQIMEWVGNDVSHIVMTHDGTRHTAPNTRQSILALDVTTVI